MTPTIISTPDGVRIAVGEVSFLVIRGVDETWAVYSRRGTETPVLLRAGMSRMSAVWLASDEADAWRRAAA